MSGNKETSGEQVPTESTSVEESSAGKDDKVPEEKMSPAVVLESEGVVAAEQTDLSEDQIPVKWVDLDVAGMIERGWQYRVKTKRNGKQYMALRKGRTDRGLGPYTPSLEKLLFHHFPEVKAEFIQRTPSGDRRTISKRTKPFLSIPIRRVAVVPTNYRPTLEVIRYFHVFKKNGFPGDFSEFINGNVEDHFVKCNGIVLPVLLEDLEKDGLIKNVQ